MVDVLTRGHRPAWLAPVGVGMLGMAAVGVLAVVDPEQRGAVTPNCPFRAVTGLDCPGCGGTRAVYALLQGDLPSALDHNALAVLLTLPLLGVAWALWLSAGLGWRAKPPTLTPRTTYGLLAVIMVFWIVRNLPVEPLAWLGSGAAG
ncbi:MAG: DUF2752 domain-containing protein [Nitriliruptoraceae bacterium]